MDARRHAPATGRNRQPLLDVLSRLLPVSSVRHLLEVASGTGEHAVFFAEHLPYLEIQPTDFDPENLVSIDAWRLATGRENVLPAQRLDASAKPWPSFRADAVLCTNMVHIAPWATCLGLLDGAAALLTKDAPLVLYGPYRRAGVVTAPSNEAFDADLRARNPEWGLRDLEVVAAEAARRGFRHDETVEMPANNVVVVFRRNVASAPVL